VVIKYRYEPERKSINDRQRNKDAHGKGRVSGYRISKETGIDETYISKIIHNRINPSYLTLKRILDVLGYRICFEKLAQRKEVNLSLKYLKRNQERGGELDGTISKDTLSGDI